MTKPHPCDCKHLGNCPFQPTSPWNLQDLSGLPLYRKLTVRESMESQLIVNGIEVRKPEVGDFVGTDTSTQTTFVIARAIDPGLAVAYAESKKGCRCKADRMLWRIKNPVPPSVDIAGS